MSLIITNQNLVIRFSFSNGEVININKEGVDVYVYEDYVYISNSDENTPKSLRINYSEVSSPSLTSNEELQDLILSYISKADINIGKVGITDGTSGISASVDDSTESLQVVEYEHHEIHAGSYYRAGFQKDIPNGGTAIWAITTPDTTKEIHFRPAVDVELEALIMFYKNPTSVTGGTSITPRNANRNFPDASVAVVVSDPTINTSGAVVLENLVEGSGKSSGGDSSSAFEWVLKRNTTYVMVVTNRATGASNECNIRNNWYEHTPKN